MSSKKALVTTTEKMVKEGIHDMETKPNMVKEATTPPIAQNKIGTVNETDKPQAYKRKKIHPSAINQKKIDHWINQGLLKALK